MSTLLIRAALETALAAMSPALPTAYENNELTPTPAAAYQVANVLFARPDNAEISASHVELGFMQVTLRYPLNTGPAAATTRAEAIRTAFPRGLSLTSGGIVTTITDTAEIMPGFIEADRYCIPVRVRFRAQV
jgi:hypothetical protein